MNQTASHTLPRCPKPVISALEKDAADLYLPFSEEEDQKARGASEPPKPFAAFGSFRQRHGDVFGHTLTRSGLSIEAPAKLESGPAGESHKGALSKTLADHNESNPGFIEATLPIGCSRPAMAIANPKQQHHRRLQHKGRSFSTDLDREEAWERKKEQYFLEAEDDDNGGDEEYDADEGFYDDLCENDDAIHSESDDGGVHNDVEADDGGHGKHDCEDDDSDDDGCRLDVATHGDGGHPPVVCVDGLPGNDDIKKANTRVPGYKKKRCSRPPSKPLLRTRTKSLTDEDMEELRGSIDLGFGFSYNERCKLKSTLPALELYYAINRSYADAKCRSSPVSPLDGNALVRTNSAGSTSSPSSEIWRISSPGDHPSQVKTRLRHWAQAVACSVKQGF